MWKAQILISFICCLVWLTWSEEVGYKARLACSMYLNFSRLPFDDDSEFPSDYSLSLCSSLAANPYSSYLIAGGFKVHSGDFPHMAAIGFGYSEPYYFGCGGSLISPNFILTAAHCSRHQNGPASVVRMGSVFIKRDDDEAFLSPIDEMIKHPDYNHHHKQNDIALIRMKRRVFFTQEVRPACINTDEHLEWDYAVATGFGAKSNYDRVGTNRLMRVSLNRIENRICNKYFKRIPDLTDAQTCAGDLTGGRDTCNGDSGGPLQKAYGRQYCLYTIIGITSYGFQCGFSMPAVYTKVSSYTGWIESIVWPKHTNP